MRSLRFPPGLTKTRIQVATFDSPKMDLERTLVHGSPALHLRIPPYRSSIRYERYSRAPASSTYSTVPSRLTSIESPAGEVGVPRNPDVKTKFPFGNFSALPRALEKFPKSTLSFCVAI